jgi:putative redox protein
MAEEGLVTIRSANSFVTTVALVEGALAQRELILFGKVDHAAGAKAVGQSLPPTLLLMFGSPKGGTPLMVANRMTGLDLPLKALVWEDDEGAVWMTYREPHAVAYEHGLDGPDFPALDGMSQIYAGLCAVVSVAAPEAVPPSREEAFARDSGPGPLRGQVNTAGQAFVTDEPFSNNGTEMGPSPHTLVSAGLAACTALTLRSYADRKGWPMTHAEVTAEHFKDEGQTPPDRFSRKITLHGDLDAEQTQRLLEIADRCPVHRTLVGGSRVETEVVPAKPAAVRAA